MIKYIKCKLSSKLSKDFNDYLYEDEIIISISPGQLNELIDVYVKRALYADSYDAQTSAREFVDGFQNAYKNWKNTRDKNGGSK